MKKIIILGLVGAIALTGCSAPASINYDKKVQTIDSVEDQLEAKINAENPGQKYDVDITKEKKKKRKKKK